VSVLQFDVCSPNIDPTTVSERNVWITAVIVRFLYNILEPLTDDISTAGVYLFSTGLVCDIRRQLLVAMDLHLLLVLRRSLNGYVCKFSLNRHRPHCFPHSAFTIKAFLLPSIFTIQHLLVKFIIFWLHVTGTNKHSIDLRNDINLCRLVHGCGDSSCSLLFPHSSKDWATFVCAIFLSSLGFLTHVVSFFPVMTDQTVL